MPIIKSAQKKLRQDIKRTAQNVTIKNAYKQAIKISKKSPTKANVSIAYGSLDRAVKKKVIHKNTASRLKSQVARQHGKG